MGAITGPPGVCLQRRRRRFNPRVGKVPWSREWQPAPGSCLENPRTEEPGGHSPAGHTGPGPAGRPFIHSFTSVHLCSQTRGVFGEAGKSSCAPSPGRGAPRANASGLCVRPDPGAQGGVRVLRRRAWSARLLIGWW